MRYALDINNKRVNIDYASSFESYFCPVCHDKLIQKKGNLISHHFAHYPNRKCSDTWHYEEMSIWHSNWQNCFKEEEQEVYKKYNNQIHRADVLIEERKIVIEFQHSNISSSEFGDRNSFYESLGYDVYWLFDMREEFEMEKIDYLYGSITKFKYLNPARTFSNFYNDDEKLHVFFQIEGDDLINQANIYSIDWVSNKGIYRFCGTKFTKSGFINKIYGIKPKLEIKKNSLFYFWKQYKCKAMIVKNIKTEKEYMIVNNPFIMMEKYHRVYGRIQNSFGEFIKEKEIVESPEQSLYKLIWFK